MLTTLLGSSLKFDGRFILQTQTDGPVSFLIVDFQAPDRLRAYARFDAKRLKDGQDSGALLGKGHLAMTIDQGPDMSRYQGLVALEGGSLEDAAHEYFLRSEQIPTRVRLAVGEEWRGGDEAETSLARRRHAAAISAQGAGAGAAGRSCIRAMRRRASSAHAVAEDDAWVEGQSLISTVEDVELIDPDLSGERLLYPAVSRTRRARVSAIAAARAMLLLARCGVVDAQELCAEGPRRDGEGRQGGGDLRVLQFGL